MNDNLGVRDLAIFKTMNMYLAAAIMAGGYVLDSVENSDPEHVIFCFEGNSSDLLEIEKNWSKRTLMVNARSYSEALWEIRGQIKEARIKR